MDKIGTLNKQKDTDYLLVVVSSLYLLCATSAGEGSMNSMNLVIPLHSSYWSIHTKDESKRGTAFAFIFGVN